MWKSTLLGLAAAAVIGLAGLISSTASAAPVAQAIQASPGVERTAHIIIHARPRRSALSLPPLEGQGAFVPALPQPLVGHQRCCP